MDLLGHALGGEGGGGHRNRKEQEGRPRQIEK